MRWIAYRTGRVRTQDRDGDSHPSGITLSAAPTKASFLAGVQCARFDKQNLNLENITFFLLPTGRSYDYLATVYRRWAQLKFSRSRSVPTKQAGKFSRTNRERLELLPWKQHCSSRPGYWLELHRAIRRPFLGVCSAGVIAGQGIR
jgi:hypothetical protein